MNVLMQLWCQDCGENLFHDEKGRIVTEELNSMLTEQMEWHELNCEVSDG